MLATAIPNHENDFKEKKKDSNGTVFTFTETTYGSVSVCELTPSGVSGYYYTDKVTKTGIVLHFTAGYLKGDIAALCKNDNHVSVPFVIARDGTIYKLFDPACWSYHLGAGSKGGNETCSKSSIAIEISNIGPLTLNGNNLITAYNDKYCDKNETQYYQELQTEFRAHKYFATFTSEQYDSLNKLIDELCSKFSIPKELLSEDKRYNVFESDDAAKKFKGISSHINYRDSGKWDIGEAFDWDKIVSATKTTASFPVKVSETVAIDSENIKKYYTHTEKETEGGYFPVGSNTLWHGGLHIFKDEGTDVFACMPGKVIAGRLAEDNVLATGPFGHRNFLLLKHTVNEKECFSLYMHLKDNPLSESDEFVKKVKWLQGVGKKSYKITGNSRNYRSSPDSSIDTNKLGSLNNGDTVEFVEDASPAPWKKVKLSDGNEVFLNCDPRYVEECTSTGVDKDMLESLKKGDVVKIDKEIQAGDLLWKMGKYGPKDEQKGLVHWEIFSEENLVAGGDESEPAIEDKKPEGVSTGYTAAKGIKVRGVTGPAKAKEGQTVTCIVTKIDYSDAPATELDKIKWDISIGSEAAACSTTGYKLEYTIPESSAGKTIKIRPYINSPSDNYCVAISVITGWTCIEDPDDDFNAENEKIVQHFGDLMADGTLTREELKKFFADNPDGKAEKLRSFACKFASEWGVKDLTAAVADLKKKGYSAKEDDYKPYLWWPEAVSAGLALPSPHVWHYNPIRFLEVFGTHVAPSQSAPAAQPAQPPAAAVGIKKCEGLATVLPGQKIVCKVIEYTKTPTDTDKKKVSWCVKQDGSVTKEEKNKGELFEYTVPETAAGTTLTIHPFMNSPSDSLYVKVTVCPYLLFNGTKLILFDKELKEAKSWNGVSGQPGFQKPENQGLKDKGPIPEGYWYVKQSELQHIADQSFADSMAGKVGRGTWPGGEDRWGKHRVWLSPVSGTDTKGRNGFCINGGKTAGSAGTIDLTGEMDGFADMFEKGKTDLILVVNYSSKKNRILGRLSSQYETGGRGSITVSSGVGDAGGVSYGAYQMTSKPNGGNVTLFVQWAAFPWKSEFEGLVAGTTQFSKKWKEIVTANKDQFEKIEHEYIQLTHYDPLVDKLKRENNINITEHSDALNDVIWSTAVQHGKGSGVVGIAINKVTVLLGKNKNYDRELIKAIYAERGRKKDDGNLYYFSKNSKKVQDGVSSRFQSELVKALKELENENY